MNIKYSLVIPCFNEEKSLEVLLRQLVVVVERLNNNVEFILVNNGSTDCTIEILSNLSSKNITLVSLDKNVGYGGGIKAGLLKCKGDFIGWIHADLQYSIFEVISELEKITSKTEYIKGKRRGRTLFQNFISLNMSVFETLMFKSLVYDINAQPTLFRRHFLVHLTDMPDDFSIDLYSYIMAKRFNLNISRFKVNFVKRSHGKSSWNSGLVSLIKMSLRTVRYSIYLRRNF